MDKSRKKFSKLYDENVDKIYRFIYLKVSSPEVAQDITSQVFMKGWKSFSEDIKNPRAFLYQIARNSIVDFYRKRDRAQFVSVDDVQVTDPTPGPEEEASLGSDVEFVKKNLKKLKAEYQDMILWRYVDDLSIKEISKIVNKKPGAVRVSLHRAVQSLKNEINEA